MSALALDSNSEEFFTMMKVHKSGCHLPYFYHSTIIQAFTIPIENWTSIISPTPEILNPQRVPRSWQLPFGLHILNFTEQHR